MTNKQYKITKKVSKESLNLTEENKIKLKKLFPSVFSENKIDFEKLKIVLGNEIDDKMEKYNFSWAGKSNSFKNIQTTAKGTLIPDKKDSVDFEKTENLFIEGDNLEVLKLLQKSYQNKVKMIYIDPPYNTGKDFVYKDNFRDSIGNYEKITGQIDDDGNRTDTNKETNGRFHSDWLTMMYPRLYLAKNLLKEDGVIFVSIDDHEVHNLRKIMDDIFGEENFVGDIIWNSTKSVTNTALISVSHTHNLIYVKDIDYYIKNRTEFRLDETGEGFANPDNDPRGLWKADPFQVGGWRPNQQYEIKNQNTGKIYKPNTQCSWKNDFKNFQKLMKDNRIVFGKNGNGGPQRKRFLSEAKERGQVTTTIWNDIDTTTNATSNLKQLFGERILFNNPKPIELIQRMMQLSTNKNSNDIILDFFAGSGTTAHAVLDLNSEDNGNRKFICVQLPEKTDETSEAYKAGYKTIAEISKERIRMVIVKIKKEDREKAKNMDLGFKVFKLSKSNYKIWENYEGKNSKELLKQMELFVTPLIAGYKNINVIYEVLIKEGYSLNSVIEEIKEIKTNKVFKISNDNKLFYICLDSKINDKTIKDLKLNKDIMFVCLDESLSDSQKMNLLLKINLRSI